MGEWEAIHEEKSRLTACSTPYPHTVIHFFGGDCFDVNSKQSLCKGIGKEMQRLIVDSITRVDRPS